MSVSRVEATATLLRDGRVLIAGGGNQWLGTYPGTHTAAELYDPRTGTFSPTASMAIRRRGHTATLLQNGQVLVVGGYGDGQATATSAELYDPSTGEFSATGSLGSPRERHSATLLQDGRVLIAGGVSPVGYDSSLATAELYDPATGKFTNTGSMSEPRALHTATLLPDGRVLIIGGQDGQCHHLATAELYDPATGKFTNTGSMATERETSAAFLLPEGRVLVAGGAACRIADTSGTEGNEFGLLATAELYDPATGTFSKTGGMIRGRSSMAAAQLRDGRVLLAGGISGVQPNPFGGFVWLDCTNTIEMYDPTSGEFGSSGSTPAMTYPRMFATATVLADGTVLIAGGANNQVETGGLDTAELYQP